MNNKPTENHGQPTRRVAKTEEYCADDEINLWELWIVAWANRTLILLVTGIFAIGSVAYALLQANIYRAEALLSPVEVRQSNSPLLGQLGAAANVIGINLNGEAGNQVQTAMAILESREFAREFIAKNELLPYLMAGKWDGDLQRSVIDPALYNKEAGVWVENEPTDWEAYKRFNSILFVTRNEDTGMVSVAVEWHDPYQAQEWVNLMVADVNSLMKQEDSQEASSAIEFLQKQLQSTQLVEMQRAFYQLIESQTRIVMLADVRDDYVFKIIDPAVVPEERVRPIRRRIAITGTFLGGLLSFLFVFIRYYVRQRVKE